jgi:hypothetical protein
LNTETETVQIVLDDKPDTAKVESSDESPSELEARIYNQYLKKRWGLPNDLTKYELSVAKAEIYDQLAGAYGVTDAEARAIVDRVYEYRKRGKQ